MNGTETIVVRFNRTTGQLKIDVLDDDVSPAAVAVILDRAATMARDSALAPTTQPESK